MQLVLTRLENNYEGFSLSLKDGTTSRTLATIDGNLTNHRGPVILLSLDQHSVYGLSHPTVISRILADGPQTLLTSEEIAQRLFVGMSASLTTVKVRNTVFRTALDTFYRLESKSKYFSMVAGKNPQQMGCLIAMGGKTILLAHGGFKPQNVAIVYEQLLVLDQITTLEIDVGLQKE